MNKIAIIGAGTIASHYLKGLEASDFFNEIIFVDINKRKRKNFKGFKFYDNFEEMVEIEKPNWVMVATPPKTHFECARKAIELGINVLVEKPSLLNAKEFNEIKLLAEKNNIIFTTVYHWQYGEEIKQLFLNKEINYKDIKSIDSTVLDPYCNKKGKIYENKLNLEGCFLDSGVNILSFLKLILPFNEFELLNAKNQYDTRKCRNKKITKCELKLLIDGVAINLCVDWTRNRNLKLTKINFEDNSTLLINHSEQSIKDGDKEISFKQMDRLDQHYYNFFVSFKGESNIEQAEKINNVLFKINDRLDYVEDKTVGKDLSDKVNFFKGSSLKRNIIVIGISLACIVGLVFFAKSDFYENVDDELIPDTLFGTFVGVVLSLLGFAILKCIYNIFEDKSKVSLDNAEFKKIYDYSYLHDVEFKGTKTQIFYNPLLIYDETKYKMNDFHVECDFTKEFSLTDIVSNNSISLYGAHASSNKAFDDMVRLSDYDPETKTFKLEKTNYFNHLITNRAIDFKIEGKYTLRQVYEHGPFISPLSDSKMSNHIGINALVFTSDGYLFVPRRSRTATISKHKITSSVACGVRLMDLENNDCSTEYLFKTLIFKKMINRLTLDEFEIKPDDVEIKFLGFGQNIYEGGKPQFYFYIKFKNINSNIAKDYSNKMYNSFLDRGKLDFDPSMFILKYDSIEIKRRKVKAEGYQIYGRKKTFKSKRFGFEKSFMANIWHLKQIDKQNKE